MRSETVVAIYPRDTAATPRARADRPQNAPVAHRHVSRRVSPDAIRARRAPSRARPRPRVDGTAPVLLSSRFIHAPGVHPRFADAYTSPSADAAAPDPRRSRASPPRSSPRPRRSPRAPRGFPDPPPKPAVPAYFSAVPISYFSYEQQTVKGPRANTDNGTPVDASRPFVKNMQGGTASCGSWGCTEGGWLSPKPRASTEYFLVLDGRGSVDTEDGRRFPFGPGDVVVLPKGGADVGTSTSAFTRSGSCTTTRTCPARPPTPSSPPSTTSWTSPPRARAPARAPLAAARRCTTSARRAWGAGPARQVPSPSRRDPWRSV